MPLINFPVFGSEFHILAANELECKYCWYVQKQRNLFCHLCYKIYSIN